jgi:hypothetical protein
MVQEDAVAAVAPADVSIAKSECCATLPMLDWTAAAKELLATPADVNPIADNSPPSIAPRASGQRHSANI